MSTTRCLPGFVPHLCSVGLLLCIVGVPARVFAQASTASVRGVVVDPDRRVVPHATVSLVNEGTNQRRVASADAAGLFTFPQLPPSMYTIEAAMDGFSPSLRSALTLNVGDERAVTVELRLPGVETSVEVRPEGSRIQESPAVGTVIDRSLRST